MTPDRGDAEDFLALTDKIGRERGFGAGQYKSTCMRRRIAVRMRARESPSYRAYSHLLDTDPSEYDRLLDALTINVTNLFRNPEAWKEVERKVLPVIWDRSLRRISCWVAGCASGEEAYTLAILWHRFALQLGASGQLSRVHILATDIDRASLLRAQEGTYAEEGFIETPAEIRARYFSREAPFAAAAELRPMVRFERRDLLLDAPPGGGLDLITCRNVIIYFDRVSQDALIRRFYDALAPGGFLVLGKVETLLGALRDLFEVVDQRQRIFRRP